jgi:hypothetical protein
MLKISNIYIFSKNQFVVEEIEKYFKIFWNIIFQNGCNKHVSYAPSIVIKMTNMTKLHIQHD